MNVMESEVFKKAKNVGLYIYCPKLNEVNTSWIVAESLNQGKNTTKIHFSFNSRKTMFRSTCCEQECTHGAFTHR